MPPTNGSFMPRMVVTVLAVLALVAIFAVADRVLKFGLILMVVFGGWMLWNHTHGKKE